MFQHKSQFFTIMVNYYLLAALEKQQISGTVYESAYNKSDCKVNVNQSRHLFVWGGLVNRDTPYTYFEIKRQIFSFP